MEQLATFSAQLKQQEPSLTLEVLSAIDYVDLTRGSANFAIIIQRPTKPELVAVHEFRMVTGVYGRKEYAERVRQLCELHGLDWITWAGHYQSVTPRPVLEKLISNFGPIFSSDGDLVQNAAVVIGRCVMVMGWPNATQANAVVAIEVGVTLLRVRLVMAMMQAKFQ